MDDEVQFGPVFHRLDFSEAIAQDLLSDYQVVVIGVDDETCRGYAERGVFVTTGGERVIDARTLASHVALAKAMWKYNLARVISFHGRVEKARKFSVELPRVIDWMSVEEAPDGDIWAEYVSGEMPTGKRRIMLGRLRDLQEGERGLLANARCLSEGVDVPTLDGVAFIDPKKSQVDIIQAVGRAIRKAPDKKVGTVIIPVFIESTEDPEKVLEGSAFRPVWDVLKAMRAHDGALADELDALRREIGRRGGEAGPFSLPQRIHFDMPVRVGTDFSRAFDVKLVKQTTASWEFWLGLLEQYAKRERTTIVPRSHIENGFKLGSWVIEQRAQRGVLSDERYRSLDAIPGWAWHVPDAQWDEGYSHLLRFVEREGNAKVPNKHLEESYRLGRWVVKKRHRRAELGCSQNQYHSG